VLRRVVSGRLDEPRLAEVLDLAWFLLFFAGLKLEPPSRLELETYGLRSETGDMHGGEIFPVSAFPSGEND
jgi:hypothetical protein